MILGIDVGGSAVKLAGIAQGEVVFSKYMAHGTEEPERRVARALEKNGLCPAGAVLTGVGAAVFDAPCFAFPVQRALEIEAMAAGTRYLTGKEEFLTVSVGTGTAFVLRKDGQTRHIGGSAFGGGALTGLCEKILGGPCFETLVELCPRGDLSRVDLLMSELPSCPPSLDPKLTAANLCKTDENTSRADWALGLLNLVMQTIGSMAYLTASGHGVETIVFTGGPTGIKETRDIIAPFTRAYGMEFLVPDYAECATAIGAATLWNDDKK